MVTAAELHKERLNNNPFRPKFNPLDEINLNGLCPSCVNLEMMVYKDIADEFMDPTYSLKTWSRCRAGVRACGGSEYVLAGVILLCTQYRRPHAEEWRSCPECGARTIPEPDGKYGYCPTCKKAVFYMTGLAPDHIPGKTLAEVFAAEEDAESGTV